MNVYLVVGIALSSVLVIVGFFLWLVYIHIPQKHDEADRKLGLRPLRRGRCRSIYHPCYDL